MEEKGYRKVEVIMTKFLGIILLMGIAIFLFYEAPYFKPTETFKRGVMHLVVDDKDVTNSLPDPVFVENDVIMVSANTAMKYFKNIYVYYDEKYDTAIITSEDKVGKIKIGDNTIDVNGIEQDIKGTSTFKMIEKKDEEKANLETVKTLYIPISSIQDVTDVEISFNEKVVATTPWGWSRSKVIEVAKKHSLKAYKRDFSLTTGVAYEGEKLYIFDTEEKESGDYLVVRNERGDLGYIQYGKIEASDIIRMNQGDKVIKYKKLFDDIKYTLAWEYAQNYTPNRDNESKIKTLRIISPTWIEVKNKNAEITDTVDESYINWAKEQGYRLWPTLKNDFISANGNMDNLSEIMNDMVLRQKLIDNVLDLAIKYKFDGINLDFEYMYKEDKDVFSEFVREFCSTLRANNLIPSVDVTIAGGSDTYSLCYDRTAISNAADYVMLMVYDQYGAWSNISGPVASLSWVKNNIEEMLGYEGVDKDKLFLCVPFYSRYWVINTETREIVKSPVAITMTQANLYLQRYKDVAKWSEEDGQYYIEVDQDDGTTIQIWVENEDALKKKIELINEYDLAGVAIWRLGYEDGNKCWKVIDETMNIQ